MKVTVIVEYEIPELDALTDEDALAIEAAVCDSAPSCFIRGDDDMFFAREFSVEVKR